MTSGNSVLSTGGLSGNHVRSWEIFSYRGIHSTGSTLCLVCMGGYEVQKLSLIGCGISHLFLAPG